MTMPRLAPLGLLGLVLLLGLGPVSCGHDVTTPAAREGYASLNVFADLAGTPAVALDMKVTASDIPSPMEFTLQGERSIVSGSVSLPVGRSRLVEIRAMDAAGIETHTGSMELSVLEGSNPTRDLELAPSGQVGEPIPVRIGNLVITIDPEVSELHVGETMQLQAAIQDVDGNSIHGAPKWSTTNGGIASVDNQGLVTANSPGVVTIAAEFQFTIGLARVFVAGESQEFFVSATTGSDANSGTRAAPFATIQHAIDAAAQTGSGGDVLVAGGSYSESLELRSMVNIKGGYNPGTWLRDPATYPSSVFGGNVAVSGNGVVGITIDGLSVWSSDGAPLPDVYIPENPPDVLGMSSVGIRLVDCRDVILSHNVIGSGRGAYGRMAPNQTGAANGSPGETGYEGGIRVTIPPGGGGGAGGAAGVAGGRGGRGQVALLFEESGDIRRSDFAPSGDGLDGLGPLGGPGGAHGTGITEDVWEQAADTYFDGIKSFFCFEVFGCDTMPDPSLDWGGDGQDGTPGRLGASGANGPGGLAFGTLAGGKYVPAPGGIGGAGQPGGGGGGGGGGGSHLALGGGSGGGGGGGGQGGTGGIPGQGAGGSFAVLLANSTDISILGNSILTRAGGRGGDGGAGGPGGAGGAGAAGGVGGSKDELDFGIFSIPTGLAKAGGVGGRGGDGGRGGSGGAGGGGGGGPTIGIVEDRVSQSSRSGNTFYIGVAGEGGESRGVVATKEGNRGADGLRAEFAKFAGVGAPQLFLEVEAPRNDGIVSVAGATSARAER